MTVVKGLETALETARREWEELDPAYTSFSMRKAAETRYLTLLALSRQSARIEGLLNRLTPPRTAAGWKRAATRAGAQ